MIRNLCKYVMSHGGDVMPLIIPSQETGGTGLMNPSIYNDNGTLILNVRHVNYTLYHCENGQLFNNRYGPLSYLNPENDIKLRTWNYLCSLNDDLSIATYNKTDTSQLDIIPVWEFIGLEDARVVRWNGKLYQCGVRRDVKDDGQGRMELSEIVDYKEISRVRIAPPNDPNSYCEKNWMPVTDMPYHFVKWTNPTEVVKVNPKEGTSATVYLSHELMPDMGDLRGGSQVIPWGEYHACIIHEVKLWKNKLQQKDAKYVHRFVVWDKQWNIVKVSEQFSFMDGEIEFCCGLTEYGDDILMTFGFQDNAAFIIKVNKIVIEDFIGIKFNEPKSKLDTFHPTYVISFHTATKRREILKKQILKYGAPPCHMIISNDAADARAKVSGQYINMLSDTSKKVAVSHLRAIKRWYEDAEEPYGIFLEDDISLETSEYWSFTWDKFIQIIPDGWDCVQLAGISETMPEIKLQPRNMDLWSVMAYMITREYAGKLIEWYCVGKNGYTLNAPRGLQPHVENLIYTSGKTYMIPLFVENAEFTTMINDRNDSEKHKTVHQHSHDVVLNWWKNNGLTTTIYKLWS